MDPKREEWTHGGKAGKETVVFDANDAFNKVSIRVSGKDPSATVDRIVRLLNGDQPGMPTYSELLAALRGIEKHAGSQDAAAYSKALNKAFMLLARAGGAA